MELYFSSICPSITIPTVITIGIGLMKIRGKIPRFDWVEIGSGSSLVEL